MFLPNLIVDTPISTGQEDNVNFDLDSGLQRDVIYHMTDDERQASMYAAYDVHSMSFAETGVDHFLD